MNAFFILAAGLSLAEKSVQLTQIPNHETRIKSAVELRVLKQQGKRPATVDLYTHSMKSPTNSQIEFKRASFPCLTF
jgi:hypothetical protein